MDSQQGRYSQTTKYNPGQTSWGTSAFLGHFSIHTGPTPPLTPKQCWTRVLSFNFV